MNNQLTDMIQNLASLYNRTLDAPALMLYQAALKHYPLSAIKRGIELCLQDEKFFPAPAAIVQAIAQDRANNPPEPDRNCIECAGTGFTQMYLRKDGAAMQAQKWSGRIPPTQEAIGRGFLVPVLEDKKNEPGVYSFAKKCEACR